MSCVIYSIVISIVLRVTVSRQDLTFPANEYEYSLKRDSLKNAERIFQGKITNLTQDERIVDHYLQHLKWLEFKKTEDIGFPPARPIEEQMNYIRTTEVYRVLKKLPKGGNMHSHENHEVNRITFLQLIYDSDQFKYLHMVAPNNVKEWTLDFFTTPPEGQGWIHVPSSNYTMEEIYQNQVLTGILDDYAKRYPSDSGERWRQMNQLWDRMETAVANLPIKKLYIEALYNQSLEEGSQYIETRQAFDTPQLLYVIDESPEYEETNGKRYLDNQGGALEINETLDILQRFIEQHPEFIGHKRIYQTVRVMEQSAINTSIQAAVDLHRKYPDHIVGFDMVAEEDFGNSHLFYLRPYLSLYDEDTQEKKMPLMIHTVETSWPDDLITSNNDYDPVATLQNSYEAIIYGAKRVGHGLGFIKHPYLLNILKERNVAVESCPVSNQILGFTPDIRNHPALHYLRAGVPVVLGADDPGSFGYDSFTIDWYDVFMAWGLDIAELKQLAMNALLYSSMTDEEKQEALDGKWQTAWDKFINETKEEACIADFSEYQPLVGMVLPREGANSGTTPVHIYGRNFTRGICKDIRCKFGDVESPRSMYMSNNHIICEAPDLSYEVKKFEEDVLSSQYSLENIRKLDKLLQLLVDHTTVPITVDFGDGIFVDIGKTFTYKYDPIVPTSIEAYSGFSVGRCNWLTIFVTIVLLLAVSMMWQQY